VKEKANQQLPAVWELSHDDTQLVQGLFCFAMPVPAVPGVVMRLQ